MSMTHSDGQRILAACLAALCTGPLVGLALGGAAAPPPTVDPLLERLDAPLLFVKRHSYTGTHI